MESKWIKFFVIVLLGLVAGVYFIDGEHALVKINDPEKTALQLSLMANQISRMNYLLTFVSLAGAIAGVAFTIFGYYQSQSFPKLVKKQVDERLKEEKKLLFKLIQEQNQLMMKMMQEEIRDIYHSFTPSYVESEIQRAKRDKEQLSTVEQLRHTLHSFQNIIRTVYMRKKPHLRHLDYESLEIIDDGIRKLISKDKEQLIEKFPEKKKEIEELCNDCQKNIRDYLDKIKEDHLDSFQKHQQQMNDFFQESENRMNSNQKEKNE